MLRHLLYQFVHLHNSVRSHCDNTTGPLLDEMWFLKVFQKTTTVHLMRGSQTVFALILDRRVLYEESANVFGYSRPEI